MPGFDLRRTARVVLPLYLGGNGERPTAFERVDSVRSSLLEDLQAGRILLPAAAIGVIGDGGDPQMTFRTGRTAGGSTLHTVNQQVNGGAWNLLGSHWFLAGIPYTITLEDAEPAGFVVIADAVRWTKP